MKLIDLCPVCGGKGKFLMQKCPSCGGKGGVLLKFDKTMQELLEQNKTKLSEQEIAIFDLYKSGFSQQEIAKNMDLKPSKVASIFYQIEKKII